MSTRQLSRTGIGIGIGVASTVAVAALLVPGGAIATSLRGGSSSKRFDGALEPRVIAAKCVGGVAHLSPAQQSVRVGYRRITSPSQVTPGNLGSATQVRITVPGSSFSVTVPVARGNALVSATLPASVPCVPASAGGSKIQFVFTPVGSGSAALSPIKLVCPPSPGTC